MSTRYAMPKVRAVLSRKAEAANQLAQDLAQPQAAFVDKVQGHMQTVPTWALVGFLRTGIDARMMLGFELSNRGLDQNGVWVGFAEAERLFVAAFPGAVDAGLLV